MTYNICFRIFGKELQCTIKAKDEKEARYLLHGKLVIDKMEPVSPKSGDIEDVLGLFDIKKK